MTYLLLFFGLCFVLGGLAVASNTSQHYGMVGLVLVSIAVCGWLLSLGVSLCLVLFMVYLGRILVSFILCL
ncbi:NU6M oxidoreductase, partial [Grallaria varia]|nr:NU6M oxidoreductase [Grallaria varia]